MAEKGQKTVKYPELIMCQEQPGGICAAIGCQASALLKNLQDAKGVEGTEERARAIIAAARKNGCKSELTF